MTDVAIPAAKAPAPRKEYTLIAPKDHPEGQPLLKQDGVELFEGDKVKLNKRQAEALSDRIK